MHIKAIENQTNQTLSDSQQQQQQHSTNPSQVLIINTMSLINGSLLNASADDDPFDGNNEPLVYMSDNRMPVMIEFNSAIIYIIFAALLLALVSILPGVRKTRLTSFVGLLTILLVGASILLALEGSYWLSGGLQLYEAPYGALTSETITGRLEVNIGLSSTNVTLFGRLMGDNTNGGGRDLIEELTSRTTNNKNLLDYNERFHWDRPDRMAAEHEEALRRGLPYPILTITEFLSQDSEGFNWMRQLRQAGYFTSMALYAALASWSLTTIIMCVLPVYLPQMMQITGALMMSSVWIYTLLVQSPKSFVIQLGGSPIEFAFGYTYVTTFVAGALSMFTGIILFVLQINKPNEQFTIMDSEQYLKDQKALYGTNIANHSAKAISHLCLAAAFMQPKTHPKPVLNRHNSVIIPIDDIEEKFKSNT